MIYIKTISHSTFQWGEFLYCIPIARLQALLQTAFRETQSGNRVVSEYIANRTARKPTDGMEMRATATHAAKIHEKRAQK